jgi:hypothetical protein
MHGDQGAAAEVSVGLSVPAPPARSRRIVTIASTPTMPAVISVVSTMRKAT